MQNFALFVFALALSTALLSQEAAATTPVPTCATVYSICASEGYSGYQKKLKSDNTPDWKCPEGYYPICGDASGWNNMGNQGKTNTLEDCTKKCDSNSKCIGVEYFDNDINFPKGSCNLNDKWPKITNNKGIIGQLQCQKANQCPPVKVVPRPKPATPVPACATDYSICPSVASGFQNKLKSDGTPDWKCPQGYYPICGDGPGWNNLGGHQGITKTLEECTKKCDSNSKCIGVEWNFNRTPNGNCNLNDVWPTTKDNKGAVGQLQCQKANQCP